MKFAVLAYESSGNFGDEIQSIAAARLLPRVDLTVPRERLRSFPLDEPCLLVMNGFFPKLPGEFPPSERIVPLYISFSIAEGADAFYTSPECVAHFNKHAPIGCRDKKTMGVLRGVGVDAYYSKCLTLAFPKRKEAKADNLIAVDLAHSGGIGTRRRRRIFGDIESVVILSHAHGADKLGDFKTAMAERLLHIYETRARLVATSRLHCALPCIAMGIPVLFFDVFDRRTDILEDIGVKTYGRLVDRPRWIAKKMEARRFHGFTWKAPSIDVDEEKEKLISLFRNKFSEITA